MDETKPPIEGVGARFTTCHPVEEDPEVVERKHRSSCLLHIYPKCRECPNRKFTLFYKKADTYLEQVLCPRWDLVASLHSGKLPDRYQVTELATCKEGPFPFCGSCPSKEKLETLSIDKTKHGWYSRWKRVIKEEGS